MATVKKIFSDIDLTFNRSPITGDIALSYDEQAVVRSISNLLSTNHYERLFQSDIGTNLESLLFENATTGMQSTIAKEIENCINNYEPRAKVQTINVSVTSDEQGYNVRMTVLIGNNTTPTPVNLLLQRTR